MQDGVTAAVAEQEAVRFLSSPAAYPERPATVEHRQTHMSHVFLTPAHVFKLKKPLAHEYVDLRTLAARAANCREEVRLNRRLAPDVYLGVVALTRDADGRYALDGGAEPVDWLVEMRRLPDQGMLDWRIAHGLRPDEVDALGQRLGGFFASQPAVAIGLDRYRDGLRQQLALSMAVLARAEFALPAASLHALRAALERYLSADGELPARVREGRIVEGHGDLRPEHICFDGVPVIIDCLEFNRALRLVDPFDEIAFLGLECARLGAPWVGPRLRRIVEARLSDRPPARLVAFFTALRACIRARLALAHLLEPLPRTPSKWLPLARDYLARAERACSVLR